MIDDGTFLPTCVQIRLTCPPSERTLRKPPLPAHTPSIAKFKNRSSDLCPLIVWDTFQQTSWRHSQTSETVCHVSSGRGYCWVHRHSSFLSVTLGTATCTVGMLPFATLGCHGKGATQDNFDFFFFSSLPSWERGKVRNTAVHSVEITGNMTHSLHKHFWPEPMIEILLQERVFTLWFA